MSLEIDTVPSRPVIVASTPGPGSVQLVWTAPVHSGGQSIGSYKVIASPCPTGGASCAVATMSNQPNTTLTDGTPAFSAEISGLTSGTSYLFEVFATNPVGASDPAKATIQPN